MDEGLNFSDIFDDSISAEVKPPEMLRPMEEDDFPTQSKDLFKGLWEQDLLTETHLQDLYHATGIFQLHKMLKDDAVKMAFVGSSPADELHNKGYSFFLSTMRQKYGNYAHDIGGRFVGIKNHVVVHLDGRMLIASGFKHFPIDYWSHGPQYSEQEERIVSNKDEIKPLNRYIKDVHVYIQPDLKHPFTIDELYQISKLAPQRGIKVYFYKDSQAFRSQLIHKATTDVSNILSPAQYTSDDLEWLKWKKERESRPKRDGYLDALMRIYKRDYSKQDQYPDKNLLRMMWWYEHDLHPALMAAAHNDKAEHLPIFREIAAAMKKEGVKSFRDFINIVKNRELDRLQSGKELQEFILLKESDELLIGNSKYNNESRQAIAFFEIYPEFWVYVKTKNGKSQLFTNHINLQKELNKLNDKYKIQQHGKILMILDKLKTVVNIPNVDYFRGAKKSIVSGRIWGINGKVYVSFWEEFDEIKQYWNKIEELLKQIPLDGKIPTLKNVLFIFGGKSEEKYVMTYDEVKGNKKDDKGDRVEIMIRNLIHTSPEAKKSLLNIGPDRIKYWADRFKITPIQLKQMLGSLDEVEMAIPPGESKKKGKTVGHTIADSIFTLYDGGLIVGMKELPTKMIFFSNSDPVEDALNIFDFQKFIPPGEDRDLQLTHTHLQRLTQSAVRRSKILPIETRRKGKIAGRIWKFNNTNGVSVIGFWQSIDQVRKHWKQLLWIFDKLEVDYKIAEYTFNNRIYRKFTYEDIVGKTQVPEIDKNELELMKLLHTSPQIKRKLLNLQPNQLSKYADKMNIPLIKLKQMMGSLD